MRVELAAEENTLSRVATFWSTITPYVPPRRFYGTHGKHHLRPEDQVINELAKLVPGKHAVEEIRLVPDWHIKVRVSLSSDGMLRPVKRQGFYVRLRSAMPLCGPIILGHSTHFGLGHFRPAE
jgi:CRISPR-associated protein Csb2